MKNENKTIHLNDEEEVPEKGYFRAELAAMYFPGYAQAYAVRRLGEFISQTKGLLEELEAVGYRKGDRFLMRKQVHVLFKYLGKP